MFSLYGWKLRFLVLLSLSMTQIHHAYFTSAHFWVYSYLAVFLNVIRFLCWVLVLVDLFFACSVAGLLRG